MAPHCFDSRRTEGSKTAPVNWTTRTTPRPTVSRTRPIQGRWCAAGQCAEPRLVRSSFQRVERSPRTRLTSRHAFCMSANRGLAWRRLHRGSLSTVTHIPWSWAVISCGCLTATRLPPVTPCDTHC